MNDGEAARPAGRPNIVLVLADDLGYSDIGCYGGEIRTPHLDELGRNGVRLSHFYNTARCSPSRASLLTGLHPHQTGIGVLTSDDAPVGYPGTLNDRCLTMAEVLGAEGYVTCLAGKWHLSSEISRPNDSWPTRRGFQRFFGTICGAGSYYEPLTLRRGELDASAETQDPDFYYTDAISVEGERFVRDCAAAGQDAPFFLYVAYTAPHWPLHAPEEDVRTYDGVYEVGWDELRRTRMQALVHEGVLPPSTELSDRDPTQPDWDDAPEKAWEARRMQVYAAQVARMDRGVGRIVQALQETDQLDDTLFIFLSDNGACAEALPELTAEEAEGFRAMELVPRTTRDGRSIQMGNNPGIEPGAEDTYGSYGRAWANLSNTPFRFYKRWTHEGGIATPFVVHWPAGGLADGTVVTTPYQLVDVLPTILETTGADYPSFGVPPLEGRSMLSVLRGGTELAPATQYWEHCGNAAIRERGWKLVREHSEPWELYTIDDDRSELHDVAGDHPEIVDELSKKWQAWADRVGVKNWSDILRMYRSRELDERAAG